MSIEYRNGDMFAAQVTALVNPVNLLGAMGKGVALEFKKRWPAMNVPYQRACSNGTLSTSSVCPIRIGPPGQLPEWAICLATKGDWRQPSRIEYIDGGLRDLRRAILSIEIPSLAMPALGCGLGGLNWPDVKALVETHMRNLNAKIYVYAPGRN